jgi:hypothetical protein
MKIGYTSHQVRLSAFAHIPKRVVCPFCGGLILLRYKRTIEGKRAYYWRHISPRGRTCGPRNQPRN